MADRTDVQSEVALAALLDTQCLAVALLDRELVDDVALWGSPGGGARDVLAAHPAVQRLVEQAATSPRPQVRATVAARTDLDPVLYALLASDPHPAVRARVAANPGAPVAVADRLCADAEATVRDAAQRRLGWCRLGA